MTTSNIRIGFSTNLIDGLNPDWDPSSGKWDILYPARHQAMELQDIVPPPPQGQWSYPEITLHESAVSLLNELIPYRMVAPSSDMDAPHIGAGALLCGAPGSSASLAKLSKVLKVDLTDAEHRYALVMLRRIDGMVTHASAAGGILAHVHPLQPDPSYGLHNDFISDSSKLPHASRSHWQDDSSQLTREDATKILNCFDKYGTHYVSAVEFGDTILQVFAYRPDKFDQIKKVYANDKNPLSGSGSQNFVQFTKDSNTGEFGLVNQYSDIICLSNATAFNQMLHNGDWFDTTWSKKNSVFALFSNNSELSMFDLQTSLTEQAPVAVTLASLSVMIEQKRSRLYQRIFKGAMVQKFRDSIQANSAIYDTRDFTSLLPQDMPDLTSCIATPTINAYKAWLDLASMQFVAAKEVKDFTLLANVLSATTDQLIDIPGRNIRLFAQVLDMRVKGQPRRLRVADEAFDSLQLACDEFLGALVVCNQSGTRYNVIIDGLRFDLEGTGPEAKPVIASDVRMPPPADEVPKLIDSLQFSMTFAEAVLGDLSYGPNDPTQNFMRQYLAWLSKFIPANSPDQEVLALRVRAMDLAYYVTDPTYGAFVPILKYGTYEDHVSNILTHLDRIQSTLSTNEAAIARRRQQELTTTVAETLNQNIIESGQLLSSVIDTHIAQQDELESYHKLVIEQEQDEARRQQSHLDELDARLFEAQGEVKKAVQNYKTAVEKWQMMESIKFALSVATGLFSVGTAIALPFKTLSALSAAKELTAVKSLGNTAKAIQQSLAALDATFTLYANIDTSLTKLKNAQNALGALDKDRPQFGNLSSLDWDELKVHFDAVIATGPDVTAEKAALNAAFSVLVLRGKAVLTAKSDLHQLWRNIYNKQLQKNLNIKQLARLKTLQGKLQPTSVSQLDREGIDLAGLSGYLVSRQSQMLQILSKAFLKLDQVLQYVYLQPATPITSFSLLKFSEARTLQNVRRKQASEALAPYLSAKTKPIDYVVSNILPEQLADGKVYQFAVSLDAHQFSPYVNIRIVSVVASVKGVKSTDSGSYLLRLGYHGAPFHDRNINRHPLNFRTPSRERIYGYRVADNTPTFDDHGESWSQNTNRVTPFSTWEISFPKVETNKGLSFHPETLTVKLSFVLEARIVDAPLEPRLPHTAARDALAARMKRSLYASTAMPSVVREARTLKSMSLGTATPRDPIPGMIHSLNTPPAQQLLGTMFGKSCTNGWDVVFNMGLNGINKVLKQQYEAFKQDPKFTNTIKFQTTRRLFGNDITTTIHLEYGYPQLVFNEAVGAKAANVRLNMMINGYVEECGLAITEDRRIIDACTKEEVKDATLTAILPIDSVLGEITVEGAQHAVFKVQLSMEKATFTASNIKMSDDVDKLNFSKNIQAHFMHNKVTYLINQLDLTHIPTLEALKPREFRFRVFETNWGNKMLQLFIMTQGGGKTPSDSMAYLQTVLEPLPMGYDCSMIIKSERIFHNVLPESLKNNGSQSGWVLEGVDPGDNTLPWSAKLAHAQVEATVDLSSMNYRTSGNANFSGISSGTSYTYTMWEDGNRHANKVKWSLDGLTLVPQKNGQLSLRGERAQTLHYSEHVRGNTQKLSADATISIQATIRAQVSGSTGSKREQSIEIIMAERAGVDIATGSLSGACSSQANQIQDQFKQKVVGLSEQIKHNLSVKFEAVSVFALKNLLFPANNYITLRECYIPGDLLLLGNFSQEP